MKKIKAFGLTTLSLPELSGFGREVLNLAEASLPLSEVEVVVDYRNALNALNAAMTTQTEKFGQAIWDADKEADKAWSNINSILQINVQHFKSERADAANVCMNVFGKYANPTRLTYSQEYAVIKNLLEDMEAIPSATLQLAQIDEWLSELRRRYEIVTNLMTDKVLSKASAEPGLTKAARVAFEDAYHTFTDKVYAICLLHQDENHINLVNQINTLIDAKRATNKAKSTAAANKKLG